MMRDNEDRRHILVARDGTEWFRDPRLGQEDRLTDYDPNHVAQIRAANFPIVNESDDWPAAMLVYQLDSLELTGDEDDLEARLNTSLILQVQADNGWTAVPMHVEFLAVRKDEDGGLFSDYAPGHIDALTEIYEVEFQTIQIRGREYIAYAIPHGT